VALVILFVAFQACNATRAPGEKSSTTQHSPSPDASLQQPIVEDSPSPEPTGSPASTTGGEASDDSGDTPPADSDMCTDDDILLIAEASRTDVTAGETVRFSMRIRNASHRTCRRDVGGDQRELYLSSGGEIVWTSRACDPPTGRDVREMAPNDERAHHIDWNGRVRVSCAQGPLVEPGEYELRARLGTDRSEAVVIVVR